MALPLTPPVPPMLARLARALPRGDYAYEPKWDGFRCLVFRDGDEVDLRSRNDRPLARYFPEIVAAVRTLDAGRLVLDGELTIATPSGFDFEALLARLHPAPTRVERLRHETPASFIAFDVLALGDDALCERPFRERRAVLEAVLRDARPPLHLTALTSDHRQAERWLARYQGAGIDGVVAKADDLRYEPGRRAMVKVKPERTAECVVGGFRLLAERPLPSSLLLGLYDGEARLRHIGVAASFSESLRRGLLEELAPRVVPLAGHPWEHGFLLAGGSTGRLPGAAARWSPEDREQDWTPVAPELVCEVAYDQVDGDRLRHPARFRRWRPDRDAASCTLEQLDVPGVRLDRLLVSA